ncbi:iron chaperone [Agromyces sp. NPDC058484]|uniref:iron chaperone n=1 Tax=Agromyces sp. NPDC058484 TaxID=3346524 RepID=UPI00364CE06A
MMNPERLALDGTVDAEEDDAMGTIDDYLADLDPADRAVMQKVYAVAREVAPDAEQGTGYGMPALVYRGKPLLSVMRAKKHIGVYPFSPDAVDAVAPGLAGFDLDKGTIRFQPDVPLPDDTVRALVAVRKAQIEG